MTEVRFYDNDSKHITTVRACCPHIDAIHVVEKRTHDKGQFDAETMFDGNPYAEYLRSHGGEPFAVEAINDNMIDDIIEWGQSGKAARILFDWDQTLSRTEGFIYSLKHPFSSGYYSWTIPEMLLVLMGGQNRLDQIVQMFKELESNSVQIYILSHNKSCNTADFKSLVYLLAPSATVLCSATPVLFKTKGAFLKAHPEFKVLCNNQNASASATYTS